MNPLGWSGGEEVAIILPAAGMKNTLRKERQICDAAAAARSATRTGQPDDDLSVTVSIGVTDFHMDDTTPGSIRNRADKALYKAKNSGKNRAVGRKS